MSFFEGLEKIAGDYLSNATPQQAADAASDHVAQADPNETADHLTQSIPSMDSSSLMSLGQHLLQQYTQHGGDAGDANAATAGAGVSQDDVAAGDPNAVASLLQYAKNNPQVLQGAASAFMQHNPGAIASLAPGLLQGIMGRLGGGGGAAPAQDSAQDQ